MVPIRYSGQRMPSALQQYLDIWSWPAQSPGSSSPQSPPSVIIDQWALSRGNIYIYIYVVNLISDGSFFPLPPIEGGRGGWICPPGLFLFVKPIEKYIFGKFLFCILKYYQNRNLLEFLRHCKFLICLWTLILKSFFWQARKYLCTFLNWCMSLRGLS